MSKKEEIAIEVNNMYKDFKMVYDKPNTLKERIVFWNKSNVKKLNILKDINLVINKGETVALLGTNGSGKSTLLKLMTKIIYPNQGEVITHGKLTSLLELGAGFHPDFTGRENIYFNASIFGLTRKEIEARIQDIIDFSELGDFIDNPVRTYSSGMYMRLAFSVAINVDADILLIDEILAVGDQHFQDKCFKRLEELRDSDKTIVIVTHSLEMVKKLCDRVIWIYHGQVRMDDKPRKVIKDYLEVITNDALEKEVAINYDKKIASICIDELTPNSIIVDQERNKIAISGWELHNDRDGIFHIYVNGEKITNIDRSPRPDVLYIHQKQFDVRINKQAGWRTLVNINNNEETLKVKCQIYDKEEKFLLTEIEKIININNEWVKK